MPAHPGIRPPAMACRHYLPDTIRARRTIAHNFPPQRRLRRRLPHNGTVYKSISGSQSRRTTASNYGFNFNQTTPENYVQVRIDNTISDKDTIFGRYTFDKSAAAFCRIRST